MLNFMEKSCHVKNKPERLINMEEIIKPIYIVNSLLGLFPYSIKYNKAKKIYETVNKSMYINSLCSISFMLIIYTFSILYTKNIMQSPEDVKMIEVIRTKINYVSELSTLVIFITVAYICAYLHRDKYIKALNMIISTWYDVTSNSKSQAILSDLRLHVNIVTIATLFIIIIAQFVMNFTRNSSIWKIFLVTFTFDMSQAIQFILLALHYTLVMMLVAILESLNDHCLSLTFNNKIIVRDVVEVKPKVMITLRQMELAYIKAFEIKIFINEIFQGPVLVSALQCFHSIVSESHTIYHGVLVENSFSVHDTLHCFIWIVYQILKIYSLSYAGNLLKLKVSTITVTLRISPMT